MSHIVLKKIYECLDEEDIGTAMAWLRYVGEHYTKGLSMMDSIDLLCVLMINHAQEIIEVGTLRLTTDILSLLI